MIRSQERYDNPEDVFLAAAQKALASVWTALPGHVESYDPASNTVVVQLGIQTQLLSSDGAVNQVSPSLLEGVPVSFPRGGGCTLTFPIKNGDECLVVFACRSIDSWWQSGGVQPQSSNRMHDRADAFALIGPMSQANKISGISTDKTQLRSDDGSTYVELDPAGKIVNITAPGGITVDAPTVHFTGALSIDKTVTADQDIKSTGGDVVATTVSLQNHVHTGVTSGASESGPPVP